MTFMHHRSSQHATSQAETMALTGFRRVASWNMVNESTLNKLFNFLSHTISLLLSGFWRSFSFMYFHMSLVTSVLGSSFSPKNFNRGAASVTGPPNALGFGARGRLSPSAALVSIYRQGRRGHWVHIFTTAKKTDAQTIKNESSFCSLTTGQYSDWVEIVVTFLGFLSRSRFVFVIFFFDLYIYFYFLLRFARWRTSNRRRHFCRSSLLFCWSSTILEIADALHHLNNIYVECVFR